jgi:prepilin-type N-terminal cleavage/methylation domain-containing protein
VLTDRRRGDDGFTLIELLVVVIVLGVLAAVAIPVYLGAQTGAKNATAQADLGNAKNAIVGYWTKNGSWPANASLTTSALGTFGFTMSAPNTASIAYKGGTAPAATANDFCLIATGTTNAKYYVTSSGSITTTPC